MVKRAGLAASLLLFACVSAWGQVQVVRDRSSSAPAPKGSEARALFLRMQSLERQILSLQGRIEQLDNKIEVLRATQRDQLGQMQSRLSLVNGGNKSAAAEDRTSAADAPERQIYLNAQRQMRQRQFQQAKLGFEHYVDNYPQGSDLVDALFWIGELSLVLKPPAVKDAKRAFTRILDNFPENKRVPTVLYKMAKIFHSQGNGVMAKALLKQVIREHGASNSNAVELAQAYLAQNFPAADG